MTATDSPVVREFWQDFLAWADNHGIDYFIGRRIGALLSAVGFADIDARGETILVSGSSLPARFWALAFEDLGQSMLESGLVSKATMNEMFGLLDNASFWTWQNSFVVTSGKKTT